GGTLCGGLGGGESASVDGAELAQRVRKGDGPLALDCRCGRAQVPDGRQLPRLLRARRERPGGCRAAEQRDERAALHSITSSARASSVGGTSRPSALAVLRFTARSNLVGCSTGGWAGRSPLRMRWT